MSRHPPQLRPNDIILSRPVSGSVGVQICILIASRLTDCGPVRSVSARHARRCVNLDPIIQTYCSISGPRRTVDLPPPEQPVTSTRLGRMTVQKCGAPREGVEARSAEPGPRTFRNHRGMRLARPYWRMNAAARSTSPSMWLRAARATHSRPNASAASARPCWRLIRAWSARIVTCSAA
jgi:hypothetical protein